MLESIEKLRGVATDLGAPLVYLLQDAYNSYEATGALLTACDEIEHEISERYIERDKAIEAPLDADGMPWNLTEKKFVNPQGNAKWIKEFIFNVSLERWELLGSDNFVSIASQCRHVKSRTVEDVLKEGIADCFTWKQPHSFYDGDDPDPRDFWEIDEAELDKLVSRVRELLRNEEKC